MVEFEPKHSSVSVSKYREMVEKLIMELTESNPILQKIKDGVFDLRDWNHDEGKMGNLER